MGRIAINRDFISKKNTYAGRNSPKYIVIHETDNTSKGAGARRHAEAQSLGHLSTSVQYYAGSDGIYQAAEHMDGTYSIGIEYGGNHAIHDANNRNTINIEVCVNADGDYEKARQNAIGLVKHLMGEAGIPANRVIRHFDAKGKYCPRKMMDSPELWEDFKGQVGQDVPTDGQPGDKKPEKPEESEGDEGWFRVGSGWKMAFARGRQGHTITKILPLQTVSLGRTSMIGMGMQFMLAVGQMGTCKVSAIPRSNLSWMCRKPLAAEQMEPPGMGFLGILSRCPHSGTGSTL